MEKTSLAYDKGRFTDETLAILQLNFKLLKNSMHRLANPRQAEEEKEVLERMRYWRKSLKMQPPAVITFS